MANHDWKQKQKIYGNGIRLSTEREREILYESMLDVYPTQRIASERYLDFTGYSIKSDWELVPPATKNTVALNMTIAMLKVINTLHVKIQLDDADAMSEKYDNDPFRFMREVEDETIN